jgi:hypothetical protein
MAGIINDALKLGGVPQSASSHVAMSTCFDIWLPGETVGPIGFISNITLGHTRTVTQIRHLNSVDAGIPVDIVVTPDIVTLGFGGFYVYNLKGSGGAMKDQNYVGPSAGRLAGVNLMRTLDQQQIPFSIVVSHAYRTTTLPTTAGYDGTTAGVTILAVYKNCTIASMSVPITIGTAAVADTGSINVGYVASGF